MPAEARGVYESVKAVILFISRPQCDALFPYPPPSLKGAGHLFVTNAILDQNTPKNRKQPQTKFKRGDHSQANLNPKPEPLENPKSHKISNISSKKP